MENGVNCDGKSWKSHGILLSVFCGNPVYNVRVCTIHRCIDISRYLSRDSYRDTLGNNFDFFFFNTLSAKDGGRSPSFSVQRLPAKDGDFRLCDGMCVFHIHMLQTTYVHIA